MPSATAWTALWTASSMIPGSVTLMLTRDLTKCSQDTYVPFTSQPTNCFTSAQLGALKEIYAGGFTSTGELVVPGTQTSAEAMYQEGWGSWFVKYTSREHLEVFCCRGRFQLSFLSRRPSPAINYLTDWSWDTDPPLSAAKGQLFDAGIPISRRSIITAASF